MIKSSKTIDTNVVVAEKEVQIILQHYSPVLPTIPIEVLDPVLSVNFDQVIPLPGKVIINGRVFKTLRYRDVSGIQTIEEVIPFSEIVDIPGFKPGSVHNGLHFPNGNDYKFFVIQLSAVEQILQPNNTFLEIIVLRFLFKVLREEQVRVCTVINPVFHCTCNQTSSPRNCCC